MAVDDLTVLVIDDDLGVRLLLEKFLSKEGYKVVVAASGKEGIDLFNSSPCPIVLLDLSLGDITGVEVARILRAKNRGDLKIIGITAYSREDIKEQYPEAFEVFDDFCFKPFSHKDLIEILKRT